MSSQTHVKNIALVGATGLLGGYILKNLLAAGPDKFNITAITRSDSTTTLPSTSNLKIAKGSYEDTSFLELTLRGQDVLVLTFHLTTPHEIRANFIKAAASAGVPWIIPSEYGNDFFNKDLLAAVPILAGAQVYRDLIDQLGKSKWIGVATGLWIDYALNPETPNLGINIKDRKARFVDDGNTSTTYSTVPQVGRAVAKLLQLPISTPSGGGPSLSDYKSNTIYVRSLSVSQNEILASVQHATGTKAEEWTVEYTPVDDYVQEGRDKGDPWPVMYGSVWKKGLGNQFFGKELTNEKLGLEEEDLDEIVRRVLVNHKSN